MNNLPIQVTSFIGREKEIAEITQALPSTRLLTLTGSGGCGKTRLALQVAARLIDSYTDGVWFVELAPLSDATLVPDAVASALSIPEQPGLPLTETLQRHFQTKSLLLLLDNCEHLLPGSAELATTLLQHCPNLRILATSRQPLSIPGEATWRVPSLSVPDLAHLPDIEHLAHYEAIRLFVARAAFSQSGFEITSTNAAVLALVSHRLDGIPLAIELAAARTRTLPLDVIATRLDDRFRLLTGGSPTSLPRQRTLRGTLDWSHDLLSGPERILFRRLSAFAGGFTLEAAEKVCAGDGLEEGDILDLLAHLVDKSLVVFDERNGQARYRLLEMVRQYGRDRLLEAERLGTMRDNHLGFFLSFAEKAEPQLEGAEQAVWFSRLEVDHDNLREALAWSMQRAPEQGLRLAGTLGRFWWLRGHFAEGRRWLKEALERAAGGSAALRAKAFSWAGNIAKRQGDYPTARSLLEKSLAINRELGEKRGIAESLGVLGSISMSEGNHASACAFLEESLAIDRQLGNKRGIASSLRGLGHETWHQGDYAAARRFLEEAMAVARESGDRPDIFALWSLGLVAFSERRYGEAHSLYQEGLRTAKELREVWIGTHLVEAFATLIAAEGHYVWAARLLGAAEAHRKTNGSPLPFSHRSDYDQPTATIRAGLKEEAFAAAWAEGRAMILEQAIDHALAPVEQMTPALSGMQKGLLTRREQEVARLIARGLTNREIASSLVISERTADAHVQHILDKLGFHSRAQVASWAVECGLKIVQSERQPKPL